MKVSNVHERWLPAAPETVWVLLDGLGGAQDRLWPHETWPAMVLDRPLACGARGGHGPVRYAVEAYDHGRRVTFRFSDQGLLAGIDGLHFFEVEERDDGCVLRHVIDANARGLLVWRWHLVVRPLHDALIEEALDKAEAAITGLPRRFRRHSPRVAFLRRLAARMSRRNTPHATLPNAGAG